MSQPASSWIRTGLAPLLILVLAFAVRGAWLVRGPTIGGAPVQRPDRIAQSFARNWAETGVFQGPAHRAGTEARSAAIAPGYPAVLAGLIRGFGARWPAAVRWVQAALGAIAALLLVVAGWYVFQRPAIGLIAGLLAALDPFSVLGTTVVADGVLAGFLVALVLACGARLGGRPDRTGWPATVLLALGLTGLILVRPELLIFAAGALLAAIAAGRSHPRSLARGLVLTLLVVAGLSPWTVRNWRLFHHLVPISTTAGLHFWWGNNPHASGGPARGSGAGLPPAASEWQRSNALGHNAVRWAIRHPGRFWTLRIKAFVYFWTGQGLWLAAPSDPVPVWRPVALIVLVLGALAGVTALTGWASGRLWIMLALWTIPLPYVLGHAQLDDGPRVALDPALILLMARAVGRLGLARAGHPPPAPSRGMLRAS